MYSDLAPVFLTLKQASAATKVDGEGGVSEWTLRREIDRGYLCASRIGRCLRVTPEELNRWRLSKAESQAVAS